MFILLSELRLIYDPVKRQDLAAQIRTAILLARCRHWAHLFIISSVAGLLLLAIGLFVGIPRILAVTLLMFVPTSLLLGFLLMNRILHKEKEFKQLQWRIDAVSSIDSDLKTLLSLPFPVDLRKWSPGVLEERLTQLEETEKQNRRLKSSDTEAQLFARLKEENPEFRRLAEKHREFDIKISEYDRIYYLTSGQERKRKELQKVKLKLLREIAETLNAQIESITAISSEVLRQLKESQDRESS